MTLNEFNLLSEDKKITTICNYGIFRSNRVLDTEIVSYYQMDMLLIELVYNADTNKIKEVRSSVGGFDLVY